MTENERLKRTGLFCGLVALGVGLYLAGGSVAQLKSEHEHPRRGVYMLNDYSQGEQIRGDMFALYWDGKYPTNFDNIPKPTCFNNNVAKGSRLTWDDLIICND